MIGRTDIGQTDRFGLDPDLLESPFSTPKTHHTLANPEKTLSKVNLQIHIRSRLKSDFGVSSEFTLSDRAPTAQ